jgi:hypothetical protein
VSARHKVTDEPTSDDERAAAYREHAEQLSSAWKADPEFGNMLNLAVAIGVTAPLANYLDQHPLTDEQRRTLAAWIRSLSRKPPGRPRGRAPGKVRDAERNVAYLLALFQADWRAQHDLERVPDRVTKEKIAELIELAATSFGVANDKISEENIRDLLKTGRIRVGRPRT